jgi:hypothetical protein
VFLGPSAVAQNPPASDELERLKQENAILKLKKENEELENDLAKLRKDRLTAMLPDTTVDPLSGETKSDSQLEPKSLAYLAARRVTCEVARKIHGKEPKTLIIHSDAEVRAVQQYRAFRQSLEYMLKQYESLPKGQRDLTLLGLGAASVAPDLAFAVLGSIAGAGALFRTNTNITGYDVTLEEPSVVAELHAALSRSTCKKDGAQNITLLYPAFHPNLKLNSDPLADSQIMKTLIGLQGAREAADKAVDKCEKVGGDCDEDKVKNYALLKGLNAQLDTVTKALGEVDAKSGVSLLGQLLNSESIFGSLQKGGRVLFIKANHSGGSNRVTQNLWTNFGSQILSHRGGTVITYILFSNEGAVESAGTLSCLTPYRKMGKHVENDLICDWKDEAAKGK